MPGDFEDFLKGASDDTKGDFGSFLEGDKKKKPAAPTVPGMELLGGTPPGVPEPPVPAALAPLVPDVEKPKKFQNVSILAEEPKAKPAVHGFVTPVPTPISISQDLDKSVDDIDGFVKAMFRPVVQPEDLSLDDFLVGPFAVHRGAIKAAMSMVSPGNAAVALGTMGVGSFGTVGKAIESGLIAGFGTAGAVATAKQGKEAYAAIQQGNWDTGFEHLGYAGTEGLLSALALRAGARGLKGPLNEIGRAIQAHRTLGEAPAEPGAPGGSPGEPPASGGGGTAPDEPPTGPTGPKIQITNPDGTVSELILRHSDAPNTPLLDSILDQMERGDLKATGEAHPPDLVDQMATEQTPQQGQGDALQELFGLDANAGAEIRAIADKIGAEIDLENVVKATEARDNPNGTPTTAAATETAPAVRDDAAMNDLLGKPEVAGKLKEIADQAGAELPPEAQSSAPEAQTGDFTAFVEQQPEATAAAHVGPAPAPTAAEPAPEDDEYSGDQVKVKTARGTVAQARYRVVEADDLVTSHDTGLNENPDYPQELQPRDRTRKASEAQIQEIAGNLDPEELGANYKASDGAPITAPGNVVISGNGRSIALKRLYDANHENGVTYRSWLLDNAQAFGLNPDTIEGMKKPVLVREMNPQGIDLPAFAKESNEDSKARMSASETAKSDAERITPAMMDLLDVGEDGDVLATSNRGFVQAFYDKVIGSGERGGLQTSKGGINQEAVSRIRNAVFAKAYGADTSIIETLTESVDSNVKNITTGMVQAAPAFARMRDGISAGQLHPLDLSDEVAEAAEQLAVLRREGQSVPDYLKQIGLFGEQMTQEGKALLELFHQYGRSPKRIAAILRAYTAAVEAAGNPNQASIFGPGAVPNKEEVLAAAILHAEKEFSSDEGPGKEEGPTLFDQGEPAPGPTPVESDGQKPAEEEKAGEGGAHAGASGGQTGERPAGAAGPVNEAGSGKSDQRPVSKPKGKRGQLLAALRERLAKKTDDELEKLANNGKQGEREVANAILDEREAAETAKSRAYRRDFFTPGNIVPAYGGLDKVLAYEEKPDGVWRVQVQRVKPDGSNEPGESPRWHFTEPRDGEPVVSRAEKLAAAKPEPPAPAPAAAQPEPDAKIDGARKLIDLVVARLQAIHDSDAPAIDNREFAKLCEQAYGGTRLSGAFDIKEAYDALEAGVNKYLLNYGRAGISMAELVDLEKELPRQADRTEKQLAFQQFSTPPALSYLAALAAGIDQGDVVLEPSAGTGDLATAAKLFGAEVIANEIDPYRRSLLAELGFSTLALDAEQLNNLLPETIAPDVVLMNPPFSAAGNRGITKDQAIAQRHVEQALLTLKEGGRLVAILPGGRGGHEDEGAGMHASAYKEWWKSIMSRYNVRANVGIPGSVYGKYGTTFSTRLVVIDNDGATPGENILKQLQSVEQRNAASLQEAYEILGDVIDSRPEQQPESAPRPDTGGDGGSPGGTRQPARPASGKPRPAGRGGSGKQPAPRQPGTVSEKVPQPEPEPQPGDGQRPGDRQRSAPDAQPRRLNPAEQVQAGVNPEALKQKEVGEGTFVGYVPQKLRGGAEHPAAIVQSAPLSAVDAPDIHYTPKLDPSLISEGKLSGVQLEAVYYAGQRHNQILSDGTRAGIFIGDGTGVGKGREISGVIADNWNQGRRRSIWVSVSADLIESARRDLDDLGMQGVPIRVVNDWKASQDIDLDEGIIFTTYASLIGESKGEGENAAPIKRLDQLSKWLGEEGIIVFDEAHKAKNAWDSGSGEPTQTGKAVLDLQEKLPQARVVYASATGATDPVNMAYMTRLGLWGDGTSFKDFGVFLAEIESGGVGAMEMVSRDLKARGAYLARTISYAGVAYREANHELTPQQRHIYDTAAKAWLTVIRNIEEAIHKTHAPGRARAKAMSFFWSSHQRFFKQLITAIKVPTAIAEIEKALAEGKSAIISVMGTGEAQQERLIAKSQEEGGDLDDIDFSPRQMLDDLIVRVFPIHAYEEFVDPKTKKKSVRPVLDADGNHVVDREALAMRENLRDSLTDINVPENPIDQIIEHFGKKGIEVAELTGRKRRIEKNAITGKKEVKKRKAEGVASKRTNLAEVEAFQAGTKRIAIISDAASTGISLHADRRAKNQQQRVHIALELKWSADKQLQDFGRSHRSNQAIAPEYVLISTEIGGDKRFSSTIARRLESIGALTLGSRSATSSGEIAKYNFESVYGRVAVQRTLKDLWQDPAGGQQTLYDMGLIRKDDDGQFTHLKEQDLQDVPRFLNRVLSLDLARQNTIFGNFIETFGRTIEAAKQQGTFDEGVGDVKALAIRLVKSEVVRTDPVDGSETKYYQLELDEPTNPLEYGDAVERMEMRRRLIGNAANQGAPMGFYRNKRSGNIVLATVSGTGTDPETGRTWRNYATTHVRGTTDRVEEADLGEKFERVLDEGEVRRWWNAKFKEVPKIHTRELHLIGGAILGVWKNLQAAGTRGLSVKRVLSDDGKRVVGVEVPRHLVGNVLRALGVGRELVDPAAIFKGVLDDGEEIQLAGDLKLRRVKVHGETAIELAGVMSHQFEDMERRGFIGNRIDGKRRFFLPSTEAAGIPILAKLLEQFPVMRSTTGMDTHSRAMIAQTEKQLANVDRLMQSTRSPAAIESLKARRRLYTARLAKASKQFAVDESGQIDYAAIADVGRSTVEDYRKIFNPVALDPTAKRAGLSLREHAAEMAKVFARAERSLAVARDYFAGKDFETEVLPFINAIEDPALGPQPNPELQGFADTMRQLLDAHRLAVQQLGKNKLTQFYVNYFPHIWQRPQQAGNVIAQILGRRPLEGTKAFTKQRKFKSFQEGYDAGLIPVSENPVDLVLLKLKEMQRYLLAHRFLAEMRSSGLAKYVPAIGKKNTPPEGWVKIPDALGTVWRPPLVPVKEALDKEMIEGLQRIAAKLNIQGFRSTGFPRGKKLGLALPAQSTVFTKFASPESVLIHEIGHVLDYRYDLEAQLVKLKPYQDELRQLADMRLTGGDPAWYERYVRKGDEKIANMVAGYVHMRERMKRVAPHTYNWFDNFVKSHPELAELRDLEYGMQLKTQSSELNVGGFIQVGHYYMPAGGAQIIANYLSPGLGYKPWYAVLRAVSNSMLQFALGFSGFHFAFTTMDAAVSKLSIAMKHAAAGNIVQAARHGALAATVLGAPALNLWKGHKIYKAYLEEALADPELAKYVDALVAGGGRVQMDAQYRTKFRQKFMDAAKSKDIAGVLGNGLLALPEIFFAWPILEWLVPRQKLGVFADMADFELGQLPAGASRNEVRAAMARAWDSVDNRMGQLVYDNLFWNRSVKDLSMILVQSVGWNLGTFREIGGGAIDTAKFGVNLGRKGIGGIRGGGGRRGGGGGGGARGLSGGGQQPPTLGSSAPTPEFTHRMSYTLALVALTFWLGAIIHYLAGTKPKTLKDYFFPVVGGVRYSLPGYLQDIVHWYHEPVQAARNKLNPMVRVVAEMLQNEDFYGVEIFNHRDPIYKEAADLLAHIAGTFRPFAVRGYMQGREKGETKAEASTQFFGVRQAPKYIDKTEAQLRMAELAGEHRARGAQTKEVFTRIRAQREISDLLRKGDRRAIVAARDAVKAGVLTEKQIHSAIAAAHKDPFLYGYKRMEAADALEIYELGDVEERRKMLPILMAKIVGLKKKPAAELEAIRSRYGKVFDLIRADVARFRKAS